MKRVIIIFLVILSPLGAIAGDLQKDPQQPGDKGRVFSEIASAASRITTISSEFIQEKHLSMLENVAFSKGRFYYKRDDRLRWELIEPVPSGFVVNGEKAKQWRGRSGPGQSFAVRQVPFIKLFTDQVFAWARADFKWMQQGYRITLLSESPVDLKLVPVLSQEKEYLDHIRIVFAAGAGHVSAVEVHETDGDFTIIRFLNTVLNLPLHDDLFD